MHVLAIKTLPLIFFTTCFVLVLLYSNNDNDNGNNNNNGAPAAEGCHAEPHTYRTHAFIFVWSPLSVENGSQARTYDDDDVAHGAHTGQLMHCIHLCNLMLEIHFMVKSRYPLTSTT